MNSFLTFKRTPKVGDEFYVIVKESPPIILSEKENKEYCLKKEDLIWKPQKRIVNFIDFTSGDAYDKDGMPIEDDIVKFENLFDAEKYCYEKNKNIK